MEGYANIAHFIKTSNHNLFRWVDIIIREYSTLYKNIKSQPETAAGCGKNQYSTLYKNIKSQHEASLHDDNC